MRAGHTAQAAANGAIVVGTVLATVAIAACRPERAVAHDGPASSLAEEACVSIPVAEARCFRLAVPENRQTPRGRAISLRIVVLPATGSDRAADPIFYLAGGPGQAATELLRDPSLVESDLRQRRDLVFADQRGTGSSNPLTCHFYGPPEDAQSSFAAFLPIDKVRACRAALEGAADLAQYTTAASVDDLEEIRAALRYPQVNLIGGSYGTRLAMEHVRRYADVDRVRTVILDSPVTPANHVPEGFGQLAARALDALLDECAASPPCAAAFPGMRDEAKAVFERVRRGPVTATVTHPVHQQRSEVTLTRDHVAEAIRYMMYSSGGASRVPLYLHEAFTGNYSPIADYLLRWRADGTFDGLYLSITCAEDVPLVALDAAERDDPTYLGRLSRQTAAGCVCRVAPRRRVCDGRTTGQDRRPGPHYLRDARSGYASSQRRRNRANAVKQPARPRAFQRPLTRWTDRARLSGEFEACLRRARPHRWPRHELRESHRATRVRHHLVTYPLL